MRWSEFEADAPRLAEIATNRLIDPGVLLVATIRQDGTPRLSPVEPLVLDGDLWLSMMLGSRKAADLLHDDRLLVHSIITSKDGAAGEIKLRGRAIDVTDPQARDRYREAVVVLGWQPQEPLFHLFRIDIGDVTFVRYAGNGDQTVTLWPDGREFVRRATSATSVGDEEPVSVLLA